MKRSLFICTLNSIIAIFISVSVVAQSNAAIIAMNTEQAPVSLVHQNDATPKNMPGNYRNAINIKIVRKFIATFKDAENVTWDKVNDGSSIARFTKDSVKTTISYNKKGTWNYTLKRYAENKMPEYIRDMVKTTWYDYSIVEVTEIMLPSEGGDIIYNILIKHVDNCKIIQIRNKQMEIFNDYTKP
jgi:hypothetical protein